MESILTPSEITYFKDFIYPSIDIALKVIAGIGLLVYLQNKERKSGLKDKMCDVYFSIIEDHDALYYHCSKVSFIETFQYSPFKRASDDAYKVYYEAIDECLGDKYTTRSECYDVMRRLTLAYRKLYFLMGKKEYMTYFSNLRQDVEEYHISVSIGELSHFSLAKRFSSEINEVNKNIKELGEHFDNKLITQGELKMKLLEELYPIYSSMSKISGEHFEALVGKHSEKMVEYINWYG